uniref:Uncharacterized protein n=1 Tax=Rhizophagus irregularis (strain DAOM 181602 / DAOM 197198 / MUCL 43194) TaxID=747089 RepID=U9UIV4_RHIID
MTDLNRFFDSIGSGSAVHFCPVAKIDILLLRISCSKGKPLGSLDGKSSSYDYMDFPSGS